MDERRRQFIDLTPKVEENGDWKERLLRPEYGSTLRLDQMYLGCQTITDMIVNNISDASINPDVLQSYRLQYPDLSQHTSFVDEVRNLSGNPDRLRGFVSGVKGKLLEVKYRDWLNDGHLPAGYVAELSEKANQSAVDIVIKDAKGQVQDQLQAKAGESLAGVKEHLERYPEVNTVIIPSDQVALAKADGLGAHVVGGHVSEDDLHNSVQHAIAQSDVMGVHFPYIGFGFLAGEVAYLLIKGKPVSFERVVARGTKMTIAAVAGQMAYLLSHSFWVGVPVTITARAIMERHSKANDFIGLLREKRKWARSWASTQQALTL